MTSYALVYERDGGLVAHAINEDRDAILREYARLRREAPLLELQVRQVPTGLALPLHPLSTFKEV